MRIRWHGHSCFEIAGSTVVVTDPHDGKSIGIRTPKVTADVVLVSHDHFDHNCSRVVKGPDAAVMTEPIMTVDRGVRIEGFEAYHDDQGGRKRGKVTLFKFELDGLSFCHLGDLGHVVDDSTAEHLAGVDILFVPVGDVFTIGPEAALQVIDKIRPRIAVPMHYRTQGLSLSIRPLQDFFALLDGRHVVKVGNEIDFAEDDLPESGTDFWVFSE
ncbi:MAG TPA: MBL fold metallo-hydrolase [Thermoplasmata archaeon]|nr:MBL fold metallo-hydrolase [Thermoplasmata archaeon]